MEGIPGFTYIPEYLTEETEDHILDRIGDENNWNTSLARRTLHYGWIYPYSGFGKLQRAPLIPDWLKVGLDKMYNCVFDQVIINEYNPGQGIGPHIDHTEYFGDTIAVISVGSPSCLMMKHRSKPVIPVMVARRSLYVLQDSARYVYKHYIPSRKKDNGVSRTTRYSITFRETMPSARGSLN